MRGLFGISEAIFLDLSSMLTFLVRTVETRSWGNYTSFICLLLTGLNFHSQFCHKRRFFNHEEGKETCVGAYFSHVVDGGTWFEAVCEMLFEGLAAVRKDIRMCREFWRFGWKLGLLISYSFPAWTIYSDSDFRDKKLCLHSFVYERDKIKMR